jgi:hypothetical protein
MRRVDGWVVLAGLLAACGAEDAGSPGTFPPTGGMVRFVLPEVPPTGDRSRTGTVPEVPVYLVFDGAGFFGLAGPHPADDIEPAGRVDPVPGGGVVLGEFGWGLILPIDGPTPGRTSGWDTIEVERLELTPLDVDGDGVGERIRATFVGVARHFSDDYWDEERPFESTVESAIVPAVPGPAELVPEAAAPLDPVPVRFELPAEVVSARIDTAAGEVPVTWEDGYRTVTFVPGALLPWGETVSLVGEARVPGSGGTARRFEVTVPVIAAPASAWAESFEAADLSGFRNPYGFVEVASESSGVPPIDGERFLLVQNQDFRLLFEIEVPDTEAPVLRLDARFAYKDGAGYGALPEVAVEVVGNEGRFEARLSEYAFGQEEAQLPGPEFASVSQAHTLEVELAELRGQRAVVSIAGETVWGSGGFNDEPPPANGRLQLDGLRVVP